MAMGVFHPYLLRVPEDAYQILRQEAAAKSISVNTLFIKMVEEHLRTHRKELVKLIDEETSESYSAVLDKLAAL
jgi:DNA-binding FrmR family transcriptional regulator